MHQRPIVNLSQQELIERIVEDLKAEEVFDRIPPCPFQGPAAYNRYDGWRPLREVPL